jgi:hypothetical protein
MKLGSATFNGRTTFAALQSFTGAEYKITGRLISTDGINASGIEYETSLLPESRHIVSFLAGSDELGLPPRNVAGATNEVFPVREWINHGVLPGTNYWIERARTFVVRDAKGTIPVDYFNPSNLLGSAPLSAALVSSNILFSQIDGKWVSEAALKPFVMIEHPHRRVLFLLLFLAVTGGFALAMRRDRSGFEPGRKAR